MKSRFLRQLRPAGLFLALAMLLAGCRSGGGEPADSTFANGEGNEPPSSGHMGQYLSEVTKLSQEHQISSVADSLVVGDTASEASHGLTLTGADVRQMTAATGTLAEEYSVIFFSAMGERADFTFDLSQPVPEDGQEPVLLEIREIHEALEQGFGYSVLVNGREVYFRTYEQIASAPNHYFVSVDRASIGDLSDVKISFVSECSTTFAISAVWAYTNFSELTEEQGVYQNMGIYLYSANSLETAAERVEPYQEYEYDLFDIGVMFRLDYMNLTVEAALEQLTNYVALSESWKMPVQIMPAMYWSSSPYGPDGQGGSFTDVKYSQVLYDSVNGVYYDTTPNVYSSTNWVTTGNDVLNNAAVDKLIAIFSRYADSLAIRTAKQEKNQLLQYVMEWGVCYKGMGTMTGVSGYGALDGGDYNSALIAKAAAQGVRLDPTDGLSYTEKLWLTNWHAAYNQMLADAYHTALSSDAVYVSGDTLVLPATQQTDHLFSHNVQWMNQNPSHDLRISGWMSGIGTGFYSSSEDMYFDDIRYYQYKTAYGRTGCVNLEMAIHNSSYIISEYLRQSYEQGLEFVTLFNDSSSYGTAETLKSLDSMAGQSASAPTDYAVSLVNVDFRRDVAEGDALLSQPAVASHSGVRLNRTNGMLEMTGSGTSSVTFRASDAGRSFAHGLTLALQAKIGTVGDQILVYVGETQDSMALAGSFRYQGGVDRFNDNCLQSFDLTSLTQGKTDVYIRLELISEQGTASVQFAKVYLNFGKTTGQADGSLPTVREARVRNLWVSARAVAENQLEAYIAKNGGGDAVTEAARTLMRNGYYSTAYTLLCGQYSELLPATYAVQGSGTLGRYPISVQFQRSALCAGITLTSYGASGISFTLAAERAMDFDMTFFDLAEGSCWRLVQTGFNSYSLIPAVPGEEGAVIATGGAVTVSVHADTEETAAYTTVAGRVYADQSGQSLRVVVQDPTVSYYAEYLTFTMAPSCTYTRRADGSTQTVTGSAATPQAGDYVILTFDEAGERVVAVEAVYGQKTAVIQSFLVPDAQNGVNGSITFTDGTTYELEYQKYTTKITVGATDAYARTLHAHELAALLTPGKTVTVTYCPESVNGSAPRLLSVSDR